MNMYEYKQSEPGLFTVGTYHGDAWQSESDHDTREAAAARVHYLNGGRNEQHEHDLCGLINAVRAIARDLAETNPGLRTAERVETLLDSAGH